MYVDPEKMTDKKTPYRARLKGIFSYSFRDSHLWYSLFAFPHGSLFSRIERVGVGMFRLMVNFAAAGAFLDASNAELTILQMIYVGVITSLMTVPGTWLLAFLFYRSYPYPRFRALWSSSIMLAKSSGSVAGSKMLASAAIKQEALLEDVTGKDVAGVKEEEEGEEQAAGEEKKTVSAVSANAGEEKKTVAAVSANTTQKRGFFGRLKERRQLRKKQNAALDDDDRVKRPYLAYWTRIIAWVLTVFGIVFSTVVVLFYAYAVDSTSGERYFDDSTSVAWIFSLLFGVLQDNFFGEPVKSLLISAIIARHPIKREGADEEDMLDKLFGVFEKLQNYVVPN